MLNECWSTHVQRGYKMKGGKRVPNCVPRGIKDSYEPEGEVMIERDYGQQSYSGQERITTGGPAAKAGKPMPAGKPKPKPEPKGLLDRRTTIMRGVPGGKAINPAGGPEAARKYVTSSYDPTAEFSDRVMREAFDKMTKGELKDYDSKAKKPGSQLGHRRDATKAEREEMAAKFQQSRGGAGEKVKKLRSLRKP